MNCHRIKIYFVHADPVVNTGLLAMLTGEGGLELLSADPLALPGAAVIIADYHRGLRFCRETGHGAGRHDQRILIVTHHDSEWDVQRAIKCGVHGYVLQGDAPDGLLEAVRIIDAGGHYLSCSLKRSPAGQSGDREELTGREREVLQLLGMGYCNKLIARELDISLGTVKNHMKAVLMKLNVAARTHAVIVAAQRGLLRIDSAAAGPRQARGFGQTMP